MMGTNKRGIAAAAQAIRAAEGRRAAEQAKRERDVIDVRKPVMAPTPEQAQRAVYVEGPVHDRLPGGGRTIRGRAFQRQARFESVEGLTAVQLRALRTYRQAFDETEMSEVKSQLDVGPGGGAGGSDAAIARVERMAFAGASLQRIEARIPTHLLATLRAVALHDKDFKAVAMERFGSRTVQRVDASRKKPKVTTSLEPLSGRHRERIRGEFMEAAAVLAAGMPKKDRPAPAPVTGSVSSDQPPAQVDPAFLDDAGRMRPLDEVRALILERLSGPATDTDGGA